jgi:hypothetical protein
VRADGSNDDNLGTAESPFKTLQYAYNQAIADGNEAIKRIVVLSDLVEAGQVGLAGSTSANDLITIEGRSVGYTIGRSSVKEADNGDNTSNSVLAISGCAKIQFVRITVSGLIAGVDTNDHNRAIRVTGYQEGNTQFVDVAKVDNGEQDTTVVTLGDGAVLTGKTSHGDARGGGISVDEGGKLVMLAGSKVTGCYSSIGAVQVYNSVFDMQGGLITLNNAEDGGGVFADGGSAFTMSDGEISYNTAKRIGGGVYLWKWGNVSQSKTPKFTMTGGKINNNTAGAAGGGVFVDKSSIFELVGGEIIDNEGKGEYNGIGGGGIATIGDWQEPSMHAVLTIKGGRISGNSVSGGGGGGVGVGDGTEFTMSGGEIIGNSSDSNDKPAAGGVFLNNNSKYQTFATFTMTGGVISGNTATGTVAAKELYKSNDAVITGSSLAKIGDLTGQTLDANSGVVKKIDDPIQIISAQ